MLKHKGPPAYGFRRTSTVVGVKLANEAPTPIPHCRHPWEPCMLSRGFLWQWWGTGKRRCKIVVARFCRHPRRPRESKAGAKTFRPRGDGWSTSTAKNIDRYYGPNLADSPSNSSCTSSASTSSIIHPSPCDCMPHSQDVLVYTMWARLVAWAEIVHHWRSEMGAPARCEQAADHFWPIVW
jgi:hypothetical protein